MGESLIRINPPVTPSSIGAVAKGDLVLNVKDYGAKGDGTTNDTTALQTALNVGGITFLPPGNYITSSLSLPSKAVVIGSGTGLTSLTLLNPTTQTLAVAAGGFSASTIALTADVAAQGNVLTVGSTSGLTVGQWLLVGDNSVPDAIYSTQKAGELLRILALTSTTITVETPVEFPYTVANSAFVRVLSSPSIDLKVSGIKFINPAPGTSTAAGLAFNSCVGVEVTECAFVGWDNPGISFNSTANFRVDGVYMRDFASDDVNNRFGYGVMANQASTRGQVLNSRFVNVRHAFTTSGNYGGFGEATDVHVENCHAISCKLAGFDTHGGASGITFQNCVSRGSQGSPGFQVRGANVSILACRAFDISSEALFTAGNPTNLTVEGCTFDRVTGPGVLLDGVLNGLTIKDTTITNVTGHGIAFQSTASGANAIIQNVLVRGFGNTSGNYGISIDGTSGLTFLTVKDNTFQNGYGGLNLTATPNRPVVENNVGINLAAGSSWINKAGGNSVFYRNRLSNIQQNNSQIDSITLSSNTTVNWNAAVSYFHRVTLQANATTIVLNNASLLEDHALITTELVQDATGSRTVSWNAVFKWANGTAPTFSTTANYRDVIQWTYDGGTGNLYEVSRSIGIH